MIAHIETFLPSLIKAIDRNGGILDIAEAERIYGSQLIEIAIKKKSVRKRSILLNAKTHSPLRIPCIETEWNNKKPQWLSRYTEKMQIII